MTVDRNGLEILDREECLALLRSQPVGRIALSAHALPAILPVTYALVSDAIVFATGAGSKSLTVSHGDVIAFEVDDFDPPTRSGWSVLTVGVARELREPDPDWEAARRLGLRPWVGRHATRVVQLATDRISGRRLAVSRLADEASGLPTPT